MSAALSVGSAHGIAAGVSSADSPAAQFQTIEWIDLIPPDVLEILLNPPDYIMDIEDGSAEDTVGGQLKAGNGNSAEDRYQQALVSTEVNENMDGTLVRIPGFIVPLEFDQDQTVTQFFLVPYFGACLHMPPPPPNQIILVDSPGGIPMEELFTPFWISGEMTTSVRENDMATSAYAMKLMTYEPYSE